jgi:hypothetical protein
MPKQLNPYTSRYTPSWEVIDNELNPYANPFVFKKTIKQDWSDQELVLQRDEGYLIRDTYTFRIPPFDPPPYEP